MIGKMIQPATLALAATLLTSATASAAYINGFEGAEYVAGTSLSSITDSLSGNTWSVYSTNGGTSVSSAIASSAHPASGSSHIRLSDTASSNIGTMLNLGSGATAMLTQPVVISFKAASLTTPTNSVNSLSIGDNNSFGSTKSWAAVSFSTTNTVVISAYKWGESYTGFSARNANGTYMTITPGTYISFEFTLDPTTYAYSSIKVNGVEQMGIAFTDPVVGSIPTSLKATPTSSAVLSATTDRYLKLWSGSGNVATFDVDDLSITAVPEPASAALMGLGSLLLLRRR